MLPIPYKKLHAQKFYVLYKFYISIYKRENAINSKVQSKVLLNVYLGL